MSSKHENKSSEVLTSAENQTVFKLVGKDCMSCVTCVAQLLRSHAPHPKKWVIMSTPVVVCLVFHFKTEDYFIRAYDIERKKQLFEERLDNRFEYITLHSFFGCYESYERVCQIGLNFSSDDEQKKFRSAIKDRMHEIRRKQPIGSDRQESSPSPPIDPKRLNEFLELVRLSKEQFEYPPTKQMVLTYIKMFGGVDNAIKEMKQYVKKDAIPPKSSQESIRSDLHEPSSIPPPPPPPPPSHSPPPPPPPPPPPLPPHLVSKHPSKPRDENAGKKSDDNRAAMMDEIKKGKKLRKVDQKEKSPKTGGRDAMMAEIRGGVKLKPADQRQRNNAGSAAKKSDTNAALHEAMKKRSQAMRRDEDSDHSGGSDDEWK